MTSAGRRLWVAGVIVLLASSCSSGGDLSPDPTQSQGTLGDAFVAERALVACFQDNGVDAELLPDGSVLSDRNGTLSLEESRDLTARCYQLLEDEGIVSVEPPTDELLARYYAAFQSLRECLADEGYSTPELVSFEVFTAEPEAFVHPLEAIIREQGMDAYQEARAKCPPP